MNKTTGIAIVAALIIGVIMGSQIGCGGRGARGGNRLLHSDTETTIVPRRDTLWRTVQQRRDVPFTVWGHDTVYLRHTERIAGRDTFWLTSYAARTDTAAYADTLRQSNEFKAEIFDTLCGNRIIGRSVRWANLTPTEVKTVTNTVLKKPALVKVFIGSDGYAGRTGGRYDFDIAPAASVLISDKYMVDLGYSIFDQQVSAGLKVKLSFRK
jgi:hypothetical protein